VTNALGNQTSYHYDANHNVASVTDGLNQTTGYTYDAANQLVKVTQPDATTLRYGYDANGQQSAQVNALGVTTTYTFDPLKRVSSTTDGLGRTTVFGYDADGNRLTRQDPGGNCPAATPVGCTTMTYDAANELTRIDYSDATTPADTFSYDADGRRTDMTVLDAMLEWRTRYGRLPSSYDWSHTHARRRGGDALERLAAERWPAASVVTKLFGTWAAARAATQRHEVDARTDRRAELLARPPIHINGVPQPEQRGAVVRGVIAGPLALHRPRRRDLPRTDRSADGHRQTCIRSPGVREIGADQRRCPGYRRPKNAPLCWIAVDTSHGPQRLGG